MNATTACDRLTARTPIRYSRPLNAQGRAIMVSFPSRWVVSTQARKGARWVAVGTIEQKDQGDAWRIIDGEVSGTFRLRDQAARALLQIEEPKAAPVAPRPRLSKWERVVAESFKDARLVAWKAGVEIDTDETKVLAALLRSSGRPLGLRMIGVARATVEGLVRKGLVRWTDEIVQQAFRLTPWNERPTRS